MGGAVEFEWTPLDLKTMWQSAVSGFIGQEICLLL